MDDDLMEFVSNSYCDDDHISTLHRQDYARNVRFTNDHRFASTFSTSSGMSPSITQRQPNYIENSPFDEHDFVEDDLQEISPPNSFSASPSKFQNRRPVQVIKRSVMHAPGQSTAPANVVRYNRTLPPNRQMISSGAKTTTFRSVNHDPQNSSLSSGTGTRIVLVPSRNIGMAGRDRQTPDSTTTGGMSRGVIKIDRNTGNKFIQFPNGSISLIQKNRPLPQLQVGRTSSPHSRLMFDFDEEKEREISEAIAREEELMRLEEERTKGGKRGNSVLWTRPLVRNVPMTQRFQTQRFIGRNDRVGHSTTPQYQSPTQINSWDNETARTCKSVLAGIVNRVCASEEQNRFVNISRTANKFSDIVTLGNVRHSMPQYVQPAPVHRVYPLQYRQPEDFLIEYIESYKREVNTLRANLENIAQDELGIGMPWRRSRTKGTRAFRKPKELSNAPFGARNSNPEAQHAQSKQRADEIIKLEPVSVKQETEDLTFNEGIADHKKLLPLDAIKSQPLSPSSHSADDEKASTKASRSRKRPRPSPEKAKLSTSGRLNTPTSTRKQNSRQQKVLQSAEADNEEGDPVLDPKKKHCSCGTSYDPKKFYLMCDHCRQWFHGKCVGITEKRAQKMDSWMCAECEKEKAQDAEELYCVCHQPYDEARFYVGCDSCEDWFHPECIDCTKEEVDKVDHFICPNCRGSASSGNISD